MTQCTICVIENDAATRQFMQDILSEEGHVVYCCGWRTATVEQIARMQAHVIIVDLNPIEPDNVVMFLMRLRQHPAIPHARMLVTSTSSHLLNSLREPLDHLGCDIMLKPFELEDFLRHVTTLCADPRTRSAAA